MSSHPTRYDRGSALICLALLVPYYYLATAISRAIVVTIAGYLLILAAYLGWSYYVVEHRPRLRHLLSPTHLGVILVGYTVGGLAHGWIPVSAIAFIHLIAVVLIFSYWFVTVGALYHTTTSSGAIESGTELPPLTVIVPAYNEAGYVSRTITSLLAADYPDEKKHIVVVDDGSTDGTYTEACQYESEMVTVVSKNNGGKYSALNYGLLFVDTDIVATVDADSVVETSALRDIVTPFLADDAVGAVASNVKIFNRGSLVTNCQTLEYVFGINIYRRVFDHLGAVSVVPGCLGAYRRSVLEEVNAYDPHTLTEDFDTTTKVLKAGYKVRFSEAVVYTEAPNTWRDLYKQRLRWYRGNIMTVRRHLFGAVNPENQYFWRIHLPVALVTMVFIPFASWVIFGTIGYIALTHGAVALLEVFFIFLSIIVLSNLLAIRIEGESPWYALYAPLFVFGYKHFHDIIMVKSIIDVVSGADLSWTNAARIEHEEQQATDPSEHHSR